MRRRHPDATRRRVLVTGGASGFGQAIARVYAARGDHVLVTDLAAEPDPAVLPAATGDGEVAYLQLDIRDEVAWEKAKSWVVEHWGGLDVLVNNAGVGAGGRIDVVPIKDSEWIVETNLLGVVKGCKAFVPLFKEQGHGHVVNVASMAGLVHAPCMASYNAVKAGVVALSETLLHELASAGVAVSVVCPSFFRTNLASSITRGSDPSVEESGAALVSKSQVSADLIAARTVAAVDKQRFIVLPSRDGRLVLYGKRLTGPGYHWAMKRVGARVVRSAAKRDAAARRG
jgi:NAD(P)-dependent dehydrogenase (short-subunit alcohol dehydrogenase family)